jgi:hypothetical protein
MLKSTDGTVFTPRAYCQSLFAIWILDPNPHQIGKLDPDPDPHQNEKQDQDRHQSEKIISEHWRVQIRKKVRDPHQIEK